MSTASYLYKARKRKNKYADEETNKDEEDDDLLEVGWLSDAWSWACSKVIMLLRNQLAYQDKASVLLETKDLTMAFCASAEDNGYEPKEIQQALPDLWKQYREALLKQNCGQ